MPFYDATAVEKYLDCRGCIAAMRAAMTALSKGKREQPLRQIIKLPNGCLFGVMPGDLTALDSFGAKLVSVFRDPDQQGRTRHRGVVVTFDLATGEVSCLADAEAITTIRTGCASAAATDALARSDARVLAIFGTGTQAASHLRSVTRARAFDEVLVWGRDSASTRDFATRMTSELGRPVLAVATAREAASRADVICTVTGARTPILFGEWIRKGTHVNLVGSSVLGPTEADTALVATARYIADYRPGALAQASEFAAARDAGLVNDDHIVGEIGEVFAGTLPGRESPEQITLYKSLGHVVQDLAAAAYVHVQAMSHRSAP